MIFYRCCTFGLFFTKLTLESINLFYNYCGCPISYPKYCCYIILTILYYFYIFGVNIIGRSRDLTIGIERSRLITELYMQTQKSVWVVFNHRYTIAVHWECLETSISHNHRMGKIRRGHSGSLIQIPCSSRAILEYIKQNSIQVVSWISAGRLHNLNG